VHFSRFVRVADIDGRPRICASLTRGLHLYITIGMTFLACVLDIAAQHMLGSRALRPFLMDITHFRARRVTRAGAHAATLHAHHSHPHYLTATSSFPCRSRTLLGAAGVSALIAGMVALSANASRRIGTP